MHSTRLRKLLVGSLVVPLLGVSLATATPAHAALPGSNGLIAAQKGDEIFFLDTVAGSVTQPIGSPLYQEDPAWSPSGDRIAFGLGGDIAVARSDGTDRKILSFAGTAGSGDLSISWHPDGASLIYLTGGGRNLESVSTTPGTEPVTLASFLTGASYAPDGQHIAITRDGLEVIDANGSNPTTLLALDGEQRAPDWSPDGSKIAFQTMGPDGWDIWVVNSDGTSPLLLTPHAANDVSPTWAPDGSAVLFRSTRGGGAGGLFTVPPTGGPVSEVPSSGGMGMPAWQPEVVGLRASKTVIGPWGAVTLKVSLADPSENPVVKLQRRRFGGYWKTFTQIAASSGTASLKLTNVNANTSFRARWAGDSSHPAVTSVPVTIFVQAIARGRLLRYAGTGGLFALYHAGSVARYFTRIIPAHPGKRVCFKLMIRRARWRQLAFDCFRLRSDSTIVVLTGPFPVGTRLRIHAEFPDKDHLPAVSTWAHFRYIA